MTGCSITPKLISRRTIRCDAWVVVVTSSGSTFTTICFRYIIWRFPAFIAHVEMEGADPSVVVRPQAFHVLSTQCTFILSIISALLKYVVALMGGLPIRVHGPIPDHFSGCPCSWNAPNQPQRVRPLVAHHFVTVLTTCRILASLASGLVGDVC